MLSMQRRLGICDVRRHWSASLRTAKNALHRRNSKDRRWKTNSTIRGKGFRSARAGSERERRTEGWTAIFHAKLFGGQSGGEGSQVGVWRLNTQSWRMFTCSMRVMSSELSSYKTAMEESCKDAVAKHEATEHEIETLRRRTIIRYLGLSVQILRV